jgi:uncharacterized damage-inducible protein DinB
MDDIAFTFIEKSRSLMTADFMPKIERCLDGLPAAEIWWRPNDASNSIGNLILHLCGNVTMWIVGGVGARPFERDRQREFDERIETSGEELLQRLAGVVKQADDVLGSLRPADLLTRRQIQDYDVTVLEAIYHVVEHFSMHTGQIITLRKARTNSGLNLWKPPVV